MPSQINKVFSLPVPPSQVLDLLVNPEFLAAKVAVSLSGEYEVTDGPAGPQVKITRSFTAELPAMIQKFIGSNLNITELQDWDTHNRVAKFTIAIAGAPIDFSGEISLTGKDQTEVKVSGNLKVNIPIFGAAIEPQVVSAIDDVLTKEEASIRSWIPE